MAPGSQVQLLAYSNLWSYYFAFKQLASTSESSTWLLVIQLDDAEISYQASSATH
jgi:hypothetical protein